ncbi:aspartate ammonia-lyase [Gleimia sp. 6138-11-ORH1]|uniref:aspartate ammonia-lyase n=1 Tax=Gleimia sp. 6138-11-ORH1 TaxID=2973937 RepID=UPI002167DE5C|nr:aspartate ammonia-lyase [Gleimia sp. 6138-11-ORH1]MCS4484151.1 aspartate ammonia-lyase [Gleimia sp. 6138-11-ORH1]
MTRVEEDLLGAREVPAEAYWGVHTLRAKENFNISGISISHFPTFVRSMVQVKKASALANARLHVMAEDVAHAIVKACDKILEEGVCLDQFPVDVFQGGAGTSVNMNTNEVVANLALELLGYEKGRYDIINPNDDVNKSQSTNDAYPTGFRIAVYQELHDLNQQIEFLAEAFERKAEEFKHIIKMGRTQLQDAVPMSLGEEFRAFAVTLREDMAIINTVSELLLEVNLGATAIGTGLNTPEGYSSVVVSALAEVTGLPVRPAHNLIEATSDTGAYVIVHGALKRLAIKLSKICNDLRLLSSGPRAGLGEIRLPSQQAGSSIMPAKVNPVIPEVVNQVCFKVMGNDVTLTMAAEAGQLQLNVMEPVIAQCLFESMTLLENAAHTLGKNSVPGITANEEVCRAQVLGSVGIITYFNEIIGHHHGDIIGKEAVATGANVADLIVEHGLLTKEEVDEILHLENLVAPKYAGRIWAPGEKGLP